MLKRCRYLYSLLRSLPIDLLNYYVRALLIVCSAAESRRGDWVSTYLIIFSFKGGYFIEIKLHIFSYCLRHK